MGLLKEREREMALWWDDMRLHKLTHKDTPRPANFFFCEINIDFLGCLFIRSCARPD